MENSRIFTIVLNVDYYDSDRVAELMSVALHVKRIACIGILGCFEKMPVGVVDSVLSIVQWKCIKKAIEKKIIEAGLTCQIQEMHIHKTGKQGIALSVSAECTYKVVLEFAVKQIEKNRNNLIGSTGGLLVEIIGERVPDRMKDKLLVKFARAKSEMLCNICERMLKKKCKLKVSLSGMELRIEKRI